MAITLQVVCQIDSVDRQLELHRLLAGVHLQVREEALELDHMEECLTDTFMVARMEEDLNIHQIMLHQAA